MRLIVALIAALTAALPSPSIRAAEEPAAPTSPHAEAARLFQEGNVLYEQGHYDEAVARFRAANRLAPDPLTIFAIAQAQRLAGDCRALQSYAAFLAAAPDTRLTVVAETHMADLAGRCPPERPVAQVSSPPRPATSVVVDTSRTAAGRVEDTPPVHRRWWLWTLAGAVVAGSAVATIALLMPTNGTPSATTRLGTMPVTPK
jgi:tetratricopeptide (TPR) repeat protein